LFVEEDVFGRDCEVYDGIVDVVDGLYGFG